MENIRKQSVKAYLLLESLITMALLSILVTVVLSALTKSKQEDEAITRQIEAYNVAQMALQSNKNKLSLNGSVIEIVKIEHETIIKNNGEELLRFEEKD
ncbi:competence type IV pilus minor pilin ComGE [Lactococcus sp.]|uniref:competence type IV pilus minor pilin ComGE n=1 Tax=Lactococcus sp. TaxID=44273 RepID=UPI0035AEC5DE